MVNTISSASATYASQAAQPAAAPKPQPQQPAAAQPSDTVSLKSAGGDPDHDGH